jgi:hypothetical protein
MQSGAESVELTVAREERTRVLCATDCGCSGDELGVKLDEEICAGGGAPGFMVARRDGDYVLERSLTCSVRGRCQRLKLEMAHLHPAGATAPTSSTLSRHVPARAHRPRTLSRALAGSHMLSPR